MALESPDSMVTAPQTKSVSIYDNVKHCFTYKQMSYDKVKEAVVN